MRNMKKWLGMTAAFVMSLALGMTALAAPSPVSSGIVQEITAATDANGNAVQVEVQALSTEGETAAEELKSEETLKTLLGDAFVEGMYMLDVQEAVIIGDKDSVSWPVTLTFQVPGVVSTTKVSVLHYTGTEWEVVESKAGEGTIEATFHSLSPVAFIVDKNTMASGSSSLTGGSQTSPKTGENRAVFGIAAAAVLAAGGAWALSRKKRA